MLVDVFVIKLYENLYLRIIGNWVYSFKFFIFKEKRF